MFNIGQTEWIVILIIVILVFGVSKLPKLGKSLGEAIRALRDSSVDRDETDVADSSPAGPEPEEVGPDEVGEKDIEPNLAEVSAPAGEKSPLSVREALDRAATMEKKQQLASVLNALFKIFGVTPYRLAKESEIDRATIGRWLKGETHPQQEKLEKILDLIPGLSPHLRQEILALAGYVTAEVSTNLPHPPQIYLSCHGQDLSVERERVADILSHPMLAFNVEVGEATLPPAEVEAGVSHSDYLVMVQGWRWVSVRHIEYQAASEEREKVTGLYFQREERSLQTEAKQFLVEVGREKWQLFTEPDGLTAQVLSGLWQTMTREARAGRAVSLHSLAGIYIVTQLLSGKESTLSTLLHRLAADSEQQVSVQQVNETEKPASKPRKWTKRHPEEPDMVLIPAGKFWMGTDRLTLEMAGVVWQDWMKDETPSHRVYLPTYAIGRYPLTNAEYTRFIKDGGYRRREFWTEAGWQAKERGEWTQPRFWTDERWNRANCPVVGVSWYECVAYCRWLTKITGRLYRLPTEAEWEKAAGGPAGNLWPWGNRWYPNRCNSREKGPGRTTPVGQYSPAGDSNYGVADMAGNVWDWCATKWGKSYPYEVKEDEWLGDYLQGTRVRVLRGGSWSSGRGSARCARRRRNHPGVRDDFDGCRLVSPI